MFSRIKYVGMLNAKGYNITNILFDIVGLVILNVFNSQFSLQVNWLYVFLLITVFWLPVMFSLSISWYNGNLQFYQEPVHYIRKAWIIPNSIKPINFKESIDGLSADENSINKANKAIMKLLIIPLKSHSYRLIIPCSNTSIQSLLIQHFKKAYKTFNKSVKDCYPSNKYRCDFDLHYIQNDHKSVYCDFYIYSK